MNKKEKMLDILGWIWMGAWFISIWTPVLKMEFFLTGTLALVIGIFVKLDDHKGGS